MIDCDEICCLTIDVVLVVLVIFNLVILLWVAQVLHHKKNKQDYYRCIALLVSKETSIGIREGHKNMGGGGSWPF